MHKGGNSHAASLQFRSPARGLQTASRALTTRTANPILEGLLIETGAGQVRITASDERLTILTRVECDVRENGRGVIPGKLFIDIVRRLQDNDSIEISMNDRFVFNIVSGATVINVAGQDADLYPALPQMAESSEVTLPQDTLREMIQKTEFAIAADDAREVLTGALLEIAGGDVTMVALDGFRMAYKREKISDVLESIRAIIPGRAIGDIGKLLPGGEDAFVSLCFSANGRLQLRLKNTDIYVTLIGGEYINYRRLLPTSFKVRAVAALETLRQCIDRAALLAREGNVNLIRFHLHDDMLEIDSNSQMGDAHEEMELEQLEGGEMTIAFNVRYMLDVVRTVDAEKIVLNFTDSLSPCVITPEDDLDYVHLVLPVRTGYTA